MEYRAHVLLCVVRAIVRPIPDPWEATNLFVGAEEDCVFEGLVMQPKLYPGMTSPDLLQLEDGSWSVAH